MQISLTPVSKGSYVDIFADVAPEKGDKSEYVLTANAITFSPRRLYASDTTKLTLLTLPVKEARQFARTLLALTRQDGDVENEREMEIRELKEKIKVADNTTSLLKGTIEAGKATNKEQKELIGRLEGEIAVLKAGAGIVNGGDMDES